MQVRPCDSTRSADGANGITRYNRLAFLNRDIAEVTIHRHEPLPVIDEYRVAIEEVVSGCGDETFARRANRLTTARRNIHALVW